MVGHEGGSAGSYLADPTSPIPSHCASIVMASTLRVKHVYSVIYCCSVLQVYPHVSSAILLDVMKRVIDDVMQIIISINLQKAGQPL